MTWLQDLKGMAEMFDDEFGTTALISGMMARVNERARPDQNRPQFEIIGIFSEHYRPMGDGRYSRDGLSETMISSTAASFSLMPTCCPWLPTQGDHVLVCELGRLFRVSDVQRHIQHRSLLVLEAMGANPAR